MKQLKSKILITCTLFALLFSSVLTSAQDLITAQEVAKIMNQKNVVVVSARKASDYAKVHIRGAVNIDVTSLCTEQPVAGLLKSTDELAQIFGEKGLTTDKHIVLYCKSGVNAGRLYWILKYMGCEKVSMMQGHMGAWRSARKPVTGAPTMVKSTTFTPSINSEILATKSMVNAKINDATTQILDCRNSEDFEAAHIENAVHINYKDLMTEEYILKSNNDMKVVLDAAGLSPSKDIILYCKTGTIAGFLYYVLTSQMGYKNVKLYDGSFNEWTS